ncbi:MAG: S9 family peptidase [Acidobacteria bacterium]|nr:S9 family peptidase [Acidobacteriota bacterium]
MIWLLLLLCFDGEKKDVTFEMAFRNEGPPMMLAQKNVSGWIDATHIAITEGAFGMGQSFSYDISSGEQQPYQSKVPRQFGYGEPALSTDRGKMAEIVAGDLIIRNLDDGSERAYTASAGEEQNPWFSPDDQKVAYTRDGNLFVVDTATGLETQLTTDGSDTVYNGWASWVYFEEILGRASRYKAYWWSPDSSKIAFLRFDDGPVKQFQIYHSEGQYGSWETTYYPKSGEVNPLVKMGVVDIKTGKTVWMDIDEHDDAYLAWPFWTPDSKTLHVQWLNRDQNHLVIFACDVANGSKKSVYEEKQPTWVEFFDDITYLEDGSGFILRSDKDGYRHLYLHDMEGKLRHRLTSGNWEVLEILGVDEANKRVFFMANHSDSANRDLMVVDLKGKKTTQVTASGGSHRISFSPDFAHYVDEFSDFWQAGNVAVYKADGTLLREIEQRGNPVVDEYKTGKLEYFRIPTEDGYDLPAWWLVPSDFDTSGATKYAVIFRIYSGPNAPTVVNSFGRFGRGARTWADHYYANHGVITISVDHRASGHFGKKGVSLMHRKFSHWEVKDLSRAVDWLREKPYIDASRIGITGHSYGGYMTLLALSKASDHFTHGVAGAPVTDWALYDSVYTERYMDTPQDNPEGYKAGSLLQVADKIKGKLRLIHGEVDDNVHAQNSLQLVDKLTAAGIQFEFMLYPGSRHRISQARHQADGEHAFWFRYFLNQSYPPAGE